MKKLLGCLLLAATTTMAFAQGSTNSPYSQFGFGEMAPEGVGFNRAMNGLGVGIHRGNQVNPLNPASYASIDSLTFLFDMGLSGQITNFNENGVKQNAKSGNFDYVLGSFRAWKNVGVTFGVLPLTNVGYSYSSSTYMPEVQTTVGETHQGEGGLHELFIGAGWRFAKPLSAGFNVGYLWGGYDHGVTTASSSAINSLSKLYSAEVRNYILSFGLQYDQKVGKEDLLTIGLTYDYGHSLKTDAECLIINTNSSITKADTSRYVCADALELPHSFGVGFSFTHGTQWMFGSDFRAQRWGKVKFPYYHEGNYKRKDDLYKDNYKITLGGEYCPRWNSRRFLERVRYRIGASYTTPYYYINGKEGPRQIGVSAGFGIPIMNGYNNRSVLNISAQWVNNTADGFIKENTFRLNIGLTFNEKWFAKWKVE
jgi:hypothetical protein